MNVHDFKSLKVFSGRVLDFITPISTDNPETVVFSFKCCTSITIESHGGNTVSWLEYKDCQEFYDTVKMQKQWSIMQSIEKLD